MLGDTRGHIWIAPQFSPARFAPSVRRERPAICAAVRVLHEAFTRAKVHHALRGNLRGRDRHLWGFHQPLLARALATEAPARDLFRVLGGELRAALGAELGDDAKGLQPGQALAAANAGARVAVRVRVHDPQALSATLFLAHLACFLSVTLSHG